MKSCTQAKIETAFVRVFAAAILGTLVWFAAEPASQYFNFELPLYLRAIAAGLTGLAGWFATKSLVNFTADCLDVPAAVAPAFDSRKTVAGKEKDSPTRKPDNRPAAANPELKQLESGVVVLSGTSVSFTVTRQADGTLSVVAVVKGLSNSQFKGNNGLRSRLENIREITWKNPQRQQDGSRRMEGTVAANAQHAEVLARLKSFTGK